MAAGAVGRINDAGREHGQIRAFNNRTFDVAKAVPTVVMRNEDYGRISRILADGTPVEVELNIVNRTDPRGRDASYNVVAEIPGTDKAQEVVMLGGHIDSWHSATGATDNAIGSATMLEAIRILQAIGVKPRRTIRVALWSGEEQGLLGSQAYVKEHFGMVENPKPEHANFAGYFNIDSGTGRARGATCSAHRKRRRSCARRTSRSPTTASSASIATTSRRRGGTDSHVVQRGGSARHRRPAGSDRVQHRTPGTPTSTPTSASSRTMRSRVAMVIAAAVYHLAMRDEMLPRSRRTRCPPCRRGSWRGGASAPPSALGRDRVQALHASSVSGPHVWKEIVRCGTRRIDGAVAPSYR